jgi:hypothetical protein
MRVLNFTVREQEMPGDEANPLNPWDSVQAVVELEGRELFRVPVSWIGLERHGEDELIDAVVIWLRSKLADGTWPG